MPIFVEDQPLGLAGGVLTAPLFSTPDEVHRFKLVITEGADSGSHALIGTKVVWNWQQKPATYTGTVAKIVSDGVIFQTQGITRFGRIRGQAVKDTRYNMTDGS